MICMYSVQVARLLVYWCMRAHREVAMYSMRVQCTVRRKPTRLCTTCVHMCAWHLAACSGYMAAILLRCKCRAMACAFARHTLNLKYVVDQPGTGKSKILPLGGVHCGTLSLARNISEFTPTFHFYKRVYFPRVSFHTNNVKMLEMLLN